MFLLTRWPCNSNLWVHCTRYKTRVKIYCDFYINPMYCRITRLNLDCKEKCSHTTDVLFDLLQRSDLNVSVLVCACFFYCFVINKLMVKGDFLSLQIHFDVNDKTYYIPVEFHYSYFVLFATDCFAIFTEPHTFL